MNTVRSLVLVVASAGIFGSHASAQEKNGAPRLYTFGDPPRQGTANDWLTYRKNAVWAKLGRAELAAIERLKKVGFRVALPSAHFKAKGGVIRLEDNPLPEGIILAYDRTQLTKRKPLVPTAEDLAPLGDLRHVVTLGLADAGADDDTLDLLAKMEALKELDLSGTGVTDAGLPKLARLKKLRKLALKQSLVSDAGLRHLAKVERLRELSVNGPRITEEGFRELAHIKELQKLDVHGKGLTGTGLGELTGLPNLTELDLSFSGVADAGISGLAKCVKVEVLNLRNTPVGDKGVLALAAMPSLKQLDLSYTRVTDKGLAEMAKPGNFAKLAWLWFSGPGITDGGIGSLRHKDALPALRVLRLAGTKVTQPGLRALCEARPALETQPRVSPK